MQLFSPLRMRRSHVADSGDGMPSEAPLAMLTSRGALIGKTRLMLNPIRLVMTCLLLLVALLAGCSSDSSPDATAGGAPEATTAPATTLFVAPATTAASAAPTTAQLVPTTTAAPVAEPDSQTDSRVASQQPTRAKRGFSSDRGTLSPIVASRSFGGVDSIDGTGRKLLAVYMVGSDLEDGAGLGTGDLHELLDGHAGLADPERVEVIVAFGGADKDGWRGMKFADISQLADDREDGAFGNEAGTDAYLYRSDGAHMGDQSSLQLFLEYLRDGYENFDQRFLTLWNHGGSYLGFGGDSNFNGDGLSMTELDNAFRDSRSDSFDIIGFDACLMASVEVARFMAPHGDYMLASEELEPGHGWLWSAVIEEYAQAETVVDAGRRIADNFVQDVHGIWMDGKTLSLVDLSRYDAVAAALKPVMSAYDDNLLTDRAYGESLIPAAARAESYNYSSRADTRTSVDLMHFASLLRDNAPNSAVESDLDRLMEAVEDFVVHSAQDGSRPNAFGIAIDAPENDGASENAAENFAAFKVGDEWLSFQRTYERFRQRDTRPPVVDTVLWDRDGTWASVVDENLASVTSAYGFIQPVTLDDGSGQDFFMLVAEEQAYPTDLDDEYFAPVWDQVWFTVEYDVRRETAWIPAYFSGLIDRDGQEHLVFTAEIDYYRAGKNYSDPEFPFDLANLSLIVHDNGEYWEIVDHYIQTYQVIYSGPDDEVGEIRFDKATYRIEPGDKLEFWNYGISLEGEVVDDWFGTADGIVTFVQEPVFLFEFLEFEDEAGETIEYYYAIFAEDIGGNWTLGELIQSEPVEDSPFGSMQVYENVDWNFEVLWPHRWIEEEPHTEDQVFRASDPNENGEVVMYAWEFERLSLRDHADLLEPWLIEEGASGLRQRTYTTAQGLRTILFEGTMGREEFFWLAYVSDGFGVEVVYWFPLDEVDEARELALHSFDSLIVR